MSEIIKIGLACIKDDRILLVKKKGSNFYILPGGKPEIGEDDATALCREIEEELGCHLDIASLVSLGSFSDQAAGMAGVTVVVKLYAGKLVGDPVPQAEIEMLNWVSPLDVDREELAPSLRNSIIPHLFDMPWGPNASVLSLNLSDVEMHVVSELAKSKGLSKTAVIRQALRLYQMADRRLSAGETMSFSGDAARSALFVGLKD